MKIVVITGVSRGIGRATAERFLKNGDFVIGTSTSGESSIEHKNLTVLQLDLANLESIETCAKSIEAMGKKIDILINNAGIWSGKDDVSAIDIDDLRKVLEVNLIGTVDLTERVIPFMRQGGHVVSVSSRAGSFTYVQKGNARHVDYNISKVALNMAMLMLGIRLKGKITVSSVHPGWVKTDMGGSDADLTPEESAEDIFTLANSQVETGQFWFKGEKFPW